MPPGVLPWIVVPLIGGLIGYVTNRLAVRMIFRPVQPVNVLGLRFQGLIGRRQPELAASIGRVVGGHLVRHEDIVEALNRLDLERVVNGAVERGLAPKIEELRKVPLVGGFLTDERVGELRERFVQGLIQDREGLASEFEKALEAGLDVHELVESKVAAFPVERLEALVLEVASRELRSIEVLGGLLGIVIGFAQVAVLQLL
ncbi:MAG: DUF445 family protein [bacterium]|nr:DUF445 family protein [bacterium]